MVHPPRPGSTARSPWSTPTPPGASSPAAEPGKADEFADFRAMTPDLLRPSRRGGWRPWSTSPTTSAATRRPRRRPFDPARPGRLRGQGPRPGPGPARVRHHRAARRAGRLEGDPACPARAAGADGRDPAGPLLRGGPGPRASPSRTGRTERRQRLKQEYEAAYRAAHPDAKRSGCPRSRARSASGRRRGCGAAAAGDGRRWTATCTRPWP